METFFENKCRFTKPLLIEMVRRALRMRRFIMFAMIAAFLFLAFDSLFWNEIAALIYFGGAAFIVLFVILNPRMVAARTHRQHLELYRTEAEATLLFNDDHIAHLNDHTGGRLNIEYASIKSVVRTKRLYLIGLKYNILMLDKDGFVQGTAGEFERFIREKAARAKIRLRPRPKASA